MRSILRPYSTAGLLSIEPRGRVLGLYSERLWRITIILAMSLSIELDATVRRWL